jgi:hypothetical protein
LNYKKSKEVYIVAHLWTTIEKQIESSHTSFQTSDLIAAERIADQSKIRLAFPEMTRDPKTSIEWLLAAFAEFCNGGSFIAIILWAGLNDISFFEMALAIAVSAALQHIVYHVRGKWTIQLALDRWVDAFVGDIEVNADLKKNILGTDLLPTESLRETIEMELKRWLNAGINPDRYRVMQKLKAEHTQNEAKSS